MTVGLIWAQAANGVIGADGALPWHLPEDLARFRELTTGCTVLMGRQTWESLPDRARPLPGRRNVVLTRQPGWSAEGAVVAHSLADALRDALADPSADMWVIGGGSVYREALAHADRVEVTELRESFEGDVHAPRLGSRWRVRHRDPESGWLLSRSGLHYRTVGYATG